MDDDVPAVLVAGAGPVGLTVAHELTRRGVRVRVIDQAAGPAETSRAMATHARTLEICHQMGLLDRLLPRGQRVRHFSLHRRGRRLVRFDTNYSGLPTRVPFSLMVDQVILEEVVRTRLSELGVDVEWGVALTDLVQDGDGVTATLTRADGSSYALTTGWLVGADGARSTVRRLLGFPLIGDAAETWLNADIVVDSDLRRDSNHLLHTSDGTILLTPFPDDGKWRAVDTVDIDGADDWEVVRARLERKISRALGRHCAVSTPTWVSVFAVQQRMIRQMQDGRCFVAGDAAHIHSPASGQGMNTGIQDGYNLAWKLADVVNGHAARVLLDSYSAERVPIGERLLSSTRTATALVALRNALAPVALPVGTAVLNHLPPLKRKIEGKIIRGFCGLALAYPDSPIVFGDRTRAASPGRRVGCTAAEARDSAGWRALCEEELTDPRWTLLVFAGDAPDVRATAERAATAYGAAISVRTVTPDGDPASGPRPLADPGDVLRSALGAATGDHVLIRPDGYLAGTARPPDPDRLDAALAAVQLNAVRREAADGVAERWEHRV